MKKAKKATSIVEAMIILLIIVTGVTGMYNIYVKSENFSTSIENKITAIQIANQGIESFINIRDTNWLRFSSDYKNCWNTLNYNISCVGNTLIDNKIKNNTSYKIYRKNDNKWYLEESATGTYSDPTYRNNFKVGLDNNGIYTQTGIVYDLNSFFTREIKIVYPNGDETSEKIEITSIVQRSDSASIQPYKIELSQILTNWKK